MQGFTLSYYFTFRKDDFELFLINKSEKIVISERVMRGILEIVISLLRL